MATNLLIFTTANLHRAAWQALLENQPGIIVTGAAREPIEISSLLTELPTTILVDVLAIRTELVRQLRTSAPEFGLLFVVERYNLEEIVGLLRVGATGFIERDASVSDLARGITAVGRGEVFLPPELATKALVALARGEVVQEWVTISLTDREQDVLNLLAQGLTNKDIAQSLILSVRTVEAHLRNIYSKLGVASRTEAALWAINHDFGQPINNKADK